MPVPEPTLEEEPPLEEEPDTPDTETVLPVPEEPEIDSTGTDSAPPVPEPEPEPVPDNGLPTYEDLTQPRTATEMATLLGLDTGRMNMLYRLAGRRGKTMSMAEVISYVRENILSNRRYSAFIPKDARAQLEKLGPQADSILAAGPRLLAKADTLVSAPEEIAPALPDTVETEPVAATPVAFAEPEPEVVEELPPTPMEILAEMAFSSMRYTSARVHSALSAAGISVSKEQLDLLFLYSGAQKGSDPSWKMSPEELLDFCGRYPPDEPHPAGLCAGQFQNTHL
jgi:hypothetical protein